MKLTAITTSGTKSTFTVSEAIFGGQVNQQLLSQAVRVYGSNQHQGTSKVKTRSEVSRTKKKWFKQKGTGNARHASRNAPIFVGGGVAHGPKGIRPANLSLSKSQKHEALKSAFSLQQKSVIISEGIESLGAKTSQVNQAFKKIVENPGLLLVIISKWNAELEQGSRNIAYAKVISAEHVTALDICTADTIVVTPEAVEALTTRLSAKKASQTAPSKQAEKKSAKTVAAKTTAQQKTTAKAKPEAKTTKTTKKTSTAKKTTK